MTDTSAARARDAKTDKVVYRGAGGAILGKDSGIKTKEQADRAIAAMLGRSKPQ